MFNEHRNENKEGIFRAFSIRFVLSLAVLACPPASTAQGKTPQAARSSTNDPLVTFVNNGFSLAGGLPGQKSEGFRGKLFVGDEVLAHMEGQVFITFHFDPGPIEFTAQTWMSPEPVGGAHLKLNLIAGRRYFVEVRTRVSWPVTKGFGIKEITCNDARKEHGQDKLLEAKHLYNAGLATAIAETSFPTCTAPDVSTEQHK